MNNRKQKLIPQLRFPEFENDGDWENKRLSSITENLSNKRVPITSNVREKGEIPYYGATGIIDYVKNYIFNENLLLISEDGANLIDRNYPIAFSISGKSWVNNHAHVLKPTDKYIQVLVEKYINSISIEDYLTGQAQPKLNKENLNKIPIPLPRNSFEQQKIANCLSSLDDLLKTQTTKLELLKEHKKGLLQNIFPQTGETKPKFRFPDFENDGDWNVEQFNKVYNLKVTNSFSRNKLNYEKGEVKNIHYGDIHTKFSSHFDITKEEVPYINLDISIIKIDEDNYCKEGDLVIADASEDIDDIGKCIEIVNLNNEKLLAGLHTFLARTIDTKIKLGFGGHLFKSNFIITQIKKEAQGAKVLGISKSRLANLDIYYPVNTKEQHKIAKCLSSLDNLISAENDKLELLKEHKKGLIQQLFPNTND